MGWNVFIHICNDGLLRMSEGYWKQVLERKPAWLGKIGNFVVNGEVHKHGPEKCDLDRPEGAGPGQSSASMEIKNDANSLPALFLMVEHTFDSEHALDRDSPLCKTTESACKTWVAETIVAPEKLFPSQLGRHLEVVLTSEVPASGISRVLFLSRDRACYVELWTVMQHERVKWCMRCIQVYYEMCDFGKLLEIMTTSSNGAHIHGWKAFFAGNAMKYRQFAMGSNGKLGAATHIPRLDSLVMH